MTPELRVLELRSHTVADVGKMLRSLADDIEANRFGEVGCVAVALLGDTLEVFGMGTGIKQDGIAPSVATLFRAGALRLEKEIESHGR